MFQVGLVENDARFNSLFIQELNQFPEGKILRQWSTAQSCSEDPIRHQIDLFIVDLDITDMSGAELIEHMSSERPDVPILLGSSNQSDDLIFGCLKRGALGFMNKTDPVSIHDSLRLISLGGAPMNPEMAQKILGVFKIIPASKNYDLSPKERHVLEGICSGHSLDQICSALTELPNVILPCLRTIYKKLHTASRDEIIRRNREVRH